MVTVFPVPSVKNSLHPSVTAMTAPETSRQPIVASLEASRTRMFPLPPGDLRGRRRGLLAMRVGRMAASVRVLRRILWNEGCILIWLVGRDWDDCLRLRLRRSMIVDALLRKRKRDRTKEISALYILFFFQ